MAESGSIGRIIADVMGIIVIISIFFVGGVVVSQLNGTSMITDATVQTAATDMIDKYGTAGTLIGLVIIVILLKDAITQVRGMGGGNK